MDTEEDQHDLCRFYPRRYLSKSVMFFLGEGGLDSVLLAERSVIVSGVTLVTTYLLHRYSCNFCCSWIVSIRLRTTCIFDSKLEATCSSWPKLGQVDPSWSVLPTCLAGVHGELHGCSRSRVSGAGHPPSIHVD